MIAGGTGITPMLQIIRAVIRGRPTGDKTEIDLIFANVNKEDILLKEDLDQLAKEDQGFRIHYVLNNPPEGWDGGVGFVTPEMITVWFQILFCVEFVLMNVVMASQSSRRYQAPALWSTSNDQRHEEGFRELGVQEGQASQQVR